MVNHCLWLVVHEFVATVTPHVNTWCVIAATDPSYRSMPNLAGRLQRASPPSHDSDSHLSNNNSRQQQPRRSLGTRTALKAPSTGGRALSPRRVSQIVAPTRTLSPMRGSSLVAPSQSMLPAPKARGIPRISSASRLPSPRRLVLSLWLAFGSYSCMLIIFDVFSLKVNPTIRKKPQPPDRLLLKICYYHRQKRLSFYTNIVVLYGR